MRHISHTTRKSRIIHTRTLLQEFAPRYAKGSILDLGAGKAKYRSILEPLSSEYITCDTFEAPHIDYIEDAHNLSFKDQRFDTVICTMVLEHVPKPWLVASEIERVLKPGGFCIITAPFMFPKHDDPEDYFRFSSVGLASLFPQCETIQTISYGGGAALIESCWRMMWCSPYKKKSGFISRNIYRTARNALEYIDKLLPPPKTIYCNVGFVGKKK